MQFVTIQNVKMLIYSNLFSKKSQKQSYQLIVITFFQLIQKAKKKVFMERKTHAIFVYRERKGKNQKK
jgi:hypothetical protein